MSAVVMRRRGFDWGQPFVYFLALVAVAIAIVPVIYECSTSNGSFTSVADADLLPQASAEAAITLSAAGSSKIGYKGSKRYLKIRLYGTGHATGIVSAALVLGAPNMAPTT